MQTDAQPEPVKERHRCKHLVSRAEHRVGSKHLCAQRVKIQISQNDTLCCPGRAAGIEDRSGIIGISLHFILITAVMSQTHKLRPLENRGFLRNTLDLTAFGQHIADPDRTGQFVLDAGDNDVLHFCILADGLDLVIKLIERNDHDTAGHVQISLDLLFRGKRMDHVGNCADQIDRIHHVNGLRTVRHGDGNSIIRPDTEHTQGACTFIDLIDHMPVGDVLAHKVHRYGSWLFPGGLLDLFVDTAVKVFQRLRQIADTLKPGGLHCLRYRKDDLALFILCPCITHFKAFLHYLLFHSLYKSSSSRPGEKPDPIPSKRDLKSSMISPRSLSSRP